MTFSAVAILLFACSSPGSTEAQRYLDDLQPLLHENRLLADQVLLLAADLHNEAARPNEALHTWTETIIPLASHLAEQSALLNTPSDWSPRHAKLSGIWSIRASAYSDLGMAIDLGDDLLWEEAKTKAGEIKHQEEEWFKSTNRTLAPMELFVSNYR